MTENKRFKIIDKEFISYYGGYGYLISDGNCKFWLWHDESESQKVCDKLNIIMEENEQLKFELKECREHKLFSRRALEKENEQLKKDNKRLIRKNKRLHRDWDKLYDLCLDKGCTEDEIIKEMER